VAVIDIGSNSIKSLVAVRPIAGGGVHSLHAQTIEARISAGINAAPPQLSGTGMARGVDAVRDLLAEAAAFSPQQTVLVATSAVRDARNGAEFRHRVQAATGHPIRLLGGGEEAALIGRGLTCDPALAARRDFYVFDLGGGSMECLAFRDRRVVAAVSLQLGCVRLTEKFIASPEAPVPPAAIAAIAGHTRAELARAAFRFALPETAPAIGTGGTVATARAIFGFAAGKGFEASSPFVPIEQLRSLLAQLGALPIEERRQVPGLKSGRADVFPAALATLVAVAEAGRFAGFQHSVYNLRFGLADELLP